MSKDLWRVLQHDSNMKQVQLVRHYQYEMPKRMPYRTRWVSEEMYTGLYVNILV